MKAGRMMSLGSGHRRLRHPPDVGVAYRERALLPPRPRRRRRRNPQALHQLHRSQRCRATRLRPPPSPLDCRRRHRQGDSPNQMLRLRALTSLLHPLHEPSRQIPRRSMQISSTQQTRHQSPRQLSLMQSLRRSRKPQRVLLRRPVTSLSCQQCTAALQCLGRCLEALWCRRLQGPSRRQNGTV